MKQSYLLRTIPFFFYSGLVILAIVALQFDFWTPLITFPLDLGKWFLTGFYNVFFVFFVGNYFRFLIIQYSFQGLGKEIPHTELWERTQFYLVIISILVVIGAGLALTITFITSYMFQSIMFGWITILFAQEIGFGLKYTFS